MQISKKTRSELINISLLLYCIISLIILINAPSTKFVKYQVVKKYIKIDTNDAGIIGTYRVIVKDSNNTFKTIDVSNKIYNYKGKYIKNNEKVEPPNSIEFIRFSFIIAVIILLSRLLSS